MDLATRLYKLYKLGLSLKLKPSDSAKIVVRRELTIDNDYDQLKGRSIHILAG